MAFDFRLPSSSALQPTTGFEFDGKSKSRQLFLTSERSGFSKSALLLIVAPFFFVAAILYTSFLGGLGQRPGIVIEKSPSCKNPIVRREWRTLSVTEKHTYLKAVQCLWEQPSRIGLNHSLYEDFPWVHSRMGNFSHNTPAFIAWHRYFLNIYERTLQEQCGYSGHLAYWDWSLDWEDMTKSPIWDSTTGFGGNGNKDSDRSVGYGHCITDGPFANRTLLYFGAEYGAHCLSRGFIHGDHLRAVFGLKVQPEALEAVLLESDYESFNLKLEEGPHNAIPRAIRGDFLRVTAPNDPVFFLHHTQLDRMWWQWQQRDPQRRLFQYSRDSHVINEMFKFGDFAPDRKVSDIMSTETALLCYRY
ncbi:2d33d938-1230-4a59-9b30-9b90f88d4d87 [Sclerotinia trifoliorum]|uniref:2d33d938-1230-4a59-9b30-9b90f88d4d87 n=1 Tax=Sclerotinia trifoliorum TaxID=28548 RepID=A0A8H2VQV0_9HELO|nr:2d33d938-1230-4a59-9b30-9b90f88d4d87 [Sclerotinia trifoliorum]